ncbi:MAG: electron transport complex subunit E [Elusimicrobia bacterium]|nr:electron transport complex subunit E [Candidatus Liberimonas magnetica]
MKLWLQIFLNGITKENPVLIMMIGLCPVLACSSTAIDALAMGIVTTFVLVSSNILVSALKRWTPSEVRIPAFIIIIASFVTIADYLMQGYFPDISKNLGVFVPLIAVNCIILGRAEVFAYKNSMWLSFLDGFGMGTGFTLVILLLGVIREALGAGTVFQHNLGISNPATLMILPPGAFITIGFLIIIWRAIYKKDKISGASCSHCNLLQICHPVESGKCEVIDELDKK